MKTKPLIFVLTLAVFSVGCSSNTKVKGTGDFFELTSRNVIERDLTRPASVDNEPSYPKYGVFPAAL